MKNLYSCITKIVAVLPLFLGLVASKSYAAEQVSANHPCQHILLQPSAETLKIEAVSANGVAVTGELWYPYSMVIQDLGLDVRTLLRLKGATVLSVGEGISELLPRLLEKGFKVKGLDIWYHTNNYPTNYVGRLMSKYVKKYGDNLVQGDAHQIPLPDESFDLVVSHKLVNNFSDLRDQFMMVDEAIRVCKKGGEVRFFGMMPKSKDGFVDYLDFVNKGRFTYFFELKDPNFRDSNGNKPSNPA